MTGVKLKGRVGAHVVILLVLYCNLNAFLMLFGIPAFWPQASQGVLPTTFLMVKMFHNFPVFTNGLGNSHCSVTAFGSATPVANGASYEVTTTSRVLSIYPFYPQRLEEAHKRICLLEYPKVDRPAMHAYIAAFIRDSYNRAGERPPLADVMLYFNFWPKVTDGYKARYSERRTVFVGKS